MDTNVFFFDIGGTLGTVELFSRDPLVVRSFTPLPNVESSLRRLRSAHCRLGIISDIGPVTSEAVQQVKSALAGAGLLSAFENELLLFGAKNSESIFRTAVATAGSSSHPNACAFIGENPNEREFAVLVGLAALHPAVVIW
jgi:FMN phosphatase YigB (HAD superfamily)